jgi:transposase
LFTFLDGPGVEPTNNRAERALGPGVIGRKLSCGNKTACGVRTRQVLANLAATAAQPGQDFIDRLTPHLPLHPASAR